MNPARILPVFRHFAIAAAACAMALSAQAANLTWDADTGTTGAQAGSGTWDTSSTNWWDGAANVSWVNGTANSGFDASLAGTDGTYTLTTGAPVSAGRLLVSTGGYTIANDGTNFLTLGYSNSTGSSTTDANAALWLAGGKTLGIGTGTDSTVVKLNVTNSGYSAQVFVGSGSTLNINAGATVLRDNSPANGGIRFVGNGTVNLYGTLALLQGNDGIRISERDGDTMNFNVKSGGVINVNTTAGNEGGASLWVAGGAAGTGSGANTLTIESGGSVSVLNTSVAFGLTRNAGPTGILNLAGTLTAPKIISLASTSTFNFTGGTLRANANQASFMTGLTGTTVNVNSDSVIDNNGFAIGIGQGMGGAAGLAFQGTGTTTLSGTNTYTGATGVNVGTLAVTGSLTSNISVAGGAALAGTGSTTGSLTMNGGSSLLVDTTTEFTANGVNFAGSTQMLFSGALTSGNTYDVVTYGAGGLSNLANLVQTSRGTLADDGANLKVTFTAGAVLTDTWNATSGTWNVGGAANWSNGSDSLFWNGDTVVFDDTPGADSTASVSGTVLPAAVGVSGATNHTIGGTGAIGGSTALTKDGTGALTISNANSYTGGTTLNAGTLNVNNASALGTGAVTVNGGTLDNTSGGAIALTTNNAQTWAGDFTFAGANALNMGNGVVTVTDATMVVTLGNNGTLGVGRISSTVGGLALAGSGTVAITTTAASSVAGTLEVGAGATLQINTGGAAGTTHDFIATGLTGSGTVANGGGVERWLIIDNGTGTGSTTFSGLLQDGGTGMLGLAKRGAGTLVIDGTNTYTGATSVGASNGAGVLVAAADNALGTGYLNFDGSGGNPGPTSRLELTGGITLQNANINLNQRNNNSDIIRNVSGDNVLTGAINVTSGGNQARVQSDAGTLTLSGNISTTSTSARNLYLQGAADGAASGVIADNPGNAAGKINLWKEGTGTWTLTNTSTYTGTTTVAAGVLAVDGSIASSSGVTVNAGATLQGTGTVATTTVSAGGYVAPGNSIGTLTVSGSMTIGGTLDVEYDDSLAGQKIDLLNVSGTLDISSATVDFADISSGSIGLSGIAYVFATYGTLSGSQFASVVDLPSGYTIDYAYGGNNIALVPEPTAALLAGLGLLGILRRRRHS